MAFNRQNYTARDYDTLLTELKLYLTDKYPNITFDWSPLSIESVFADIVCFIADNLHLYIDSALSECFIDTMAEKSAIQSFGKLVSYSPVQRSASIATCSYVYTKKDPAAPANVTLSKGTTFKSKGGFNFVAAADYILDELYVNPNFYLTQGTLVTDTFSATTAPNQTVTSTRPKVASNYTPTVTVNGVLWTKVDHLVNETAGNYYELVWNGSTTFTVKFGDGTYGNIPTNNIVLEYLITEGLAGNVAAEQLKGKLNSLHPQVEITYVNDNASSGGDNEESIENARKNIPASVSSANTVVTESDYEYIISQFSGVRFSSFEFDPVLRKIICYVLSSSYGAVSDLTLLELEKTINAKRQIASSIFFKNVDFVNALVNLNVYLDNSLNLNVDERKAYIIDKINRFFIPNIGDPVYNMVGKNIKMSDFIGMIENIEGVSYLDVMTFTREPALTKITWSTAADSIYLDGWFYRPSVKATDQHVKSSYLYIQSAPLGGLTKEQLRTTTKIPRIVGSNIRSSTAEDYRVVSQFGGRLTGGWSIQPTSVIAEKVNITMNNAGGKYAWASWYNTGTPGAIPSYYADRSIGKNADSQTAHFTVTHWLDGYEYPNSYVGYLGNVYELNSGSFAFLLNATAVDGGPESLFIDLLDNDGYVGWYRCTTVNKHIKVGTILGTITTSGGTAPIINTISDDGKGGLLWNSEQIGFIDYDRGEVLIEKARLGTGRSLTSLRFYRYKYYDFPNICGERSVIYLSPFLGNIQVNKNEFCRLGELDIKVGFE